MSLYSPSIMYGHHTKGYNKVYHSRNKQNWEWGEWEEDREREKGGKKQKKTFNSAF